MLFWQMLSELWPPKPRFTEEHLGDHSGKVYLVTGGASGIGFELLKALYPTSARLYLAGRSESKGKEAIAAIKSHHADVRNGFLEFVLLDLGDLTTIKSSADDFLAREKRLDVLWLNAGVMIPPAGSKTTQGYDLQLGTNVLGHYLFATLLVPLLVSTAESAPAGSVRTVWVSSSAHYMAPKNGGINWDDINYTKDIKGALLWEAYGQSKAGDIILGREFARRYGDSGVVSVSLNPGNLKSNLQRHVNTIGNLFIGLLLWKPWYGGMTLLYAGCSPDIKVEHNGRYILPWGRLGQVRTDIWTADGERFWNYCEDQVKNYRGETK